MLLFMYIVLVRTELSKESTDVLLCNNNKNNDDFKQKTYSF